MRARTRLLAVSILAVALAATACTGESGDVDPRSPAPSESPLPTEDIDVRLVEGEYTYENNGVVATFSWHDGEGTLTIDNGSGQELGPPSLYAVTPQQTEVSATVDGAAAIPDGGSVTLQVTFPDTLKPADAGLIALVFGDHNWGALSPVVSS